MVEHLGRRPVLNMDQLAELKDVRPRCETPGGMKLNHDSRGNRNRIWFFSIDGTLRGNRLKGCLFAGDCIMVQASSFEKAHRLAAEGLHGTLELAIEYWRETQGALLRPMENLKVDVGGRKHHDVVKQPDLASDPKLKAMIEHLIGGKPWRG